MTGGHVFQIMVTNSPLINEGFAIPYTRQNILDGDLRGDDLPDFGNRVDNSLHVVTGEDGGLVDGLLMTLASVETER